MAASHHICLTLRRLATAMGLQMVMDLNSAGIHWGFHSRSPLLHRELLYANASTT